MKSNLNRPRAAFYSVLFSLLFLSVGFKISPIQAQTPYPFTSNSGKYSITFPAKPEMTNSDSESATTYKTSCAVGDVTYFVGHTLHNQEMPNPEELSEVSLESFNSTLGGEITTSGPWKFKKNTGRDARISMADQEALVWYKCILVGSIQYQLVVVAPAAAWDEKTAKKFMKSFKLLK